MTMYAVEIGSGAFAACIEVEARSTTEARQIVMRDPNRSHNQTILSVRPLGYKQPKRRDE